MLALYLVLKIFSQGRKIGTADTIRAAFKLLWKRVYTKPDTATRKSDTSGQMGRASQQTRHNFRKSDTHNQLVSLAYARINGMAPCQIFTSLSPAPPLSCNRPRFPRLKYARETIPRRKKTRWKATVRHCGNPGNITVPFWHFWSILPMTKIKALKTVYEW
ncbi:hypothetical protein B0H10DRAFT_1951773 [Mycena sp. CBHHK59/15]|nr:hypothetical protein B0H10DRAFT_1951773 [Mycena sp. CBHHK59/15]